MEKPKAMEQEEQVSGAARSGATEQSLELHWWSSTVSAFFVGGLLLVVAYLLAIRLRAVIYLFVAGFCVAYALEPLVLRLQRKGWRRVGAVWAVFAGLVAVLALCGWALVPALVSQAMSVAEHFDDYSQQVLELYNSVSQGTQAWVDSHLPHLGTWVDSHLPHLGIWEMLDERIPEVEAWATEHVPDVLRWVSRQLMASLGVVGIGILLLVISFHFMMLAETLRRTVRKLIPREHTSEVREVSTEIGTMLGQYLRGMLALFFANGAGAAIIMYVLGAFFGNKYALVVGLLTGLTNMVPYVGPVVSAGSAAALTYVTATSNPGLASILAGLLMLAMSQYFAIIVQPKLIGRRINLDPLVVLFAMFAGYELFGLIGVIIGMPIAGCIKIILAKWIPAIGPGPEVVRAPSEPLLLDVSEGIKGVWGYFRRLHGGAEGSAAGESSAEPKGEEAETEVAVGSGTEQGEDEDE